MLLCCGNLKAALVRVVWIKVPPTLFMGLTMRHC